MRAMSWSTPPCCRWCRSALAFSVLKAFGAHNTGTLLTEFLPASEGRASDEMVLQHHGLRRQDQLQRAAPAVATHQRISFGVMVGPVCVLGDRPDCQRRNTRRRKIVSIEPFGLLFYGGQMLPYLLIIAATASCTASSPTPACMARSSGRGIFAGVAGRPTACSRPLVSGATNTTRSIRARSSSSCCLAASGLVDPLVGATLVPAASARSPGPLRAGAVGTRR